MILTQKQFFRRIKVKNDLLPILLSIIIMIDNGENKKQAEFFKIHGKKIPHMADLPYEVTTIILKG